MSQNYHKTVFQIPYSDDAEVVAAGLVWHENASNGHGPHIKVYANRKDAETGEPIIIIRCKHRSWGELRELSERVTDALEELYEGESTQPT